MTKGNAVFQRVNVYGREFTLAAEPSDFLRSVDTGVWEFWTFRIFDAFLTPETTCIDAGAWIGVTALYASCLCKRVYAVEPDPVAFRILAGNVAANNAGNIELFEGALADRQGTCTVGGSKLGDSMTRMSCKANAVTVPCTTLREFVNSRGIEDPVFIKMDVEGAETLILKDVDFFVERKPDLYMSTHGWWQTEDPESGKDGFAILMRVGKLYKHAYHALSHIPLTFNEPGDLMVVFTDKDI